MVFGSGKAVWRAAALAVALATALASQALADNAKSEAPIPPATLALMAAKDTSPAAPILIRTYKLEGDLEVWKRARNGRYVHLKTFPICRWSGQLGPKLRNGDRQAPEGFYPVTKKQLNPNSAYYLSFDIGFPNAYDRAHGASGSFLMVHGTCSSAGCYAMTDKQVGEIYALAREAFAGGQSAFQFQAYPFRMTAQNMARHRSDPHIAFWRQLKEGSDRFEATGEEPAVGVADGRYVFAPYKDPAKEAAAKARRAEEDARFASLVEGGIAGVRTTYADGGGHPMFRYAQLNAPASLGMVSRPEALAFAGREVIVIPARKKPACPGPACPTQVAEAKLDIPPPPAVEPLRMPPPAPGFLLAHPHPISGPEPSLFARTAMAAPTTPPNPAPGSTRIVPATWTTLRF